jgi:hypothetical protein
VELKGKNIGRKFHIGVISRQILTAILEFVSERRKMERHQLSLILVRKFCFVSETGSYYVVQVGLKLMILLL